MSSPRTCTRRDGEPKRKFFDLDHANNQLRKIRRKFGKDTAPLHVYKCPTCEAYHIGRPPTKVERTRLRILVLLQDHLRDWTRREAEAETDANRHKARGGVAAITKVLQDLDETC